MIDGNKYIMKDCGIDSLRIRRKWCLAKSEYLKKLEHEGDQFCP